MKDYEREHRMRTAYCTILAMAVCLAAAGRELVWTGAVNSNWSGAANWKDATTGETGLTFANGDSVRIDDTSSTTKITVNARISPSNVVFDVTRDLEIYFSNSSYGFSKDVKSIAKHGSGNLSYSFSGSSWNVGTDNLNVCPIDIYGGIIGAITRANYNSYGDSRVPFTVTVHDGGCLWLRHHCTTGINSDDASSLISGNMDVYVFTGGVFKAYVDQPKSATDSSTMGCNPIGWLTLDGGSLEYGNGWDTISGFMAIGQGMRFRGPEPYVFTNNPALGTYQCICLRANAGNTEQNVEFDVADITGDDEADVTFAIPFTRVLASSASTNVCLLKTGAGRMVLDVAAQATFPPRVRVEEGVLDLAKAKTTNANVTRDIHVSTNAELRLTHKWGFCDLLYDKPTNTGDVSVVVDHGTLSIPDTTPGYAYLGSLTLDHATFVPHTNLNEHSNASLNGLQFVFGRMLKVLSDSPMPFNYKSSLYKWEDGGTEFNVGETDGELWDLSLGKLINHRNDGGSFWSPGGIRKTGPGALALNEKTSEFTGGIRVDEGTLLIGTVVEDRSNGSSGNSSILGNLTEGKSASSPIFVNTNGTLRFHCRNVLPNYGDITNGTSAKSATVQALPVTIHVCGKMKFDQNTIQAIPNLTVEDGTIEYENGFVGTYGVFKVQETFKVIGKKQFHMPFDPTKTSQHLCLNAYPRTIFDISDNTGDARADAIFDIPLRVQRAFENNVLFTSISNVVKVGFVKRGAGTMQVNDPGVENGGHPPNGLVTVEDGVLEVNGALDSLSGVAVQAGAFLAGTGVVTSVTIQSGGGLFAVAGQKTPLRLTGGLSLPASGVVRLYNPDNLPDKSLKANILQVEGAVTGDLSGWTVEGDDEGRMALTLSNGVLSVHRIDGTALIFR